MASATETGLGFDIKQIANQILKAIDKDREREIVARRFGLGESRQTLEEIGRLLGITRERVRQIEKQVVTRLSGMDSDHLKQVNDALGAELAALGNVAPVSELARRLGATTGEKLAHLHFLITLAPDIEVVTENDYFYQTAALRQYHDTKALHDWLEKVIDAIKKIGRPASLGEIRKTLGNGLDEPHLHGLMRSTKTVASLEDKWGLTSWPLVNPRSIRDKIYVVLQKQGSPMHFGAIADAIKQSDFKRRDVTTQAIHNELIKDDRFVLVGRGIYGLSEWGFKKGTVAEVIVEVLRAEAPLHRDEIVKRVLLQRQVKPTTIVLNLQGKKHFKRVAKATYALAD